MDEKCRNKLFTIHKASTQISKSHETSLLWASNLTLPILWEPAWLTILGIWPSLKFSIIMRAWAYICRATYMHRSTEFVFGLWALYACFGVPVSECLHCHPFSYKPMSELLLHICSLNDVDVSFLIFFLLWHISLPKSPNSEPVVNALRREKAEIFELLWDRPVQCWGIYNRQDCSRR